MYSIAAALAQADEFLRSRPWSVQTTYNTAGAAKQIAERRERGSAAVASARVAGIYGLEVLADDIQTRRRQPHPVRGDRAAAARRRAVIAAARPGAADGPPRTTLVFAVRNVPGSLHRSLGAFARARAQPVAARVAPVDRRAGPAGSTCSGSTSTPIPPTPTCAAALDELGTETEVVRILGTYAQGRRGLGRPWRTLSRTPA